MRRLRPEELNEVLSREPPAGAQGVVLAVRGGELILVVPAATPDGQVVAVASCARGTVRLENERVMTFEIHSSDGEDSFSDHDAGLHRGHLAPPDDPPPSLERLTVAGAPLSAGQVMTRQVLTASPDDLVEDIAKRLAFHNVSGMPVEDWDGTVLGVVSEADVIGKQGVTIADVMSNELISAQASTSVEAVAGLMAERHVRRVPILEAGRLAGIVTRSDIVRALAMGVAASG
jgi:CBS domain-containing protein